MNSDKDNVHPLLTHIIPAGHCTCQTSTTFNCSESLATLPKKQPSTPAPVPSAEWNFEFDRDKANVNLSPLQCKTAFPGLFEDPYRAAAFWDSQLGISNEHLDKIELKDGMARAIIHRGELYIVATKAAQEDHRKKILAVLSSMHHALSATAGNRTQPSIEFVFSIEDRVDDISGPGHPIWALSRKASEESIWLIPDFGFWAWDNAANAIGPYNQVVDRIQRQEVTVPWSSKENKLVWRGKLSFAPKLRRNLLDIARDTSWGDVKEIVWSEKQNFISMDDHCKYKFIAHVEGRAYSSSLKYRQACRFVVVAHKLQFIQHHHYLLQSTGPYQNFVEVERDFSDLPAKMEHLLANQDLAERIAKNNAKTFRERYLTKAAEACYWRELWASWATVFNAIITDSAVDRGLRFESFLLLETLFSEANKHGADPHIITEPWERWGMDILAINNGVYEHEYRCPGGSALSAAALGGNKEIVSLLLEPEFRLSPSSSEYHRAILCAGIPIYDIQYFKDQMLWEAVCHNRESTVQWLVDNGTDINRDGPLIREHGCALHLAAQNGYGNLIRLLLDQGEDMSYVSSYMSLTPMRFAARGGHLEAVQVLVDENVGIQALVRAIMVNTLGIISILAAAGVPLNNDDSDLLRDPVHKIENMRKIS
ncbi:uncharacterized protein TERG_12030 [Trichophyton rubrum CBS 118892]|uniref:Glycosyl transferase CAP10 domain-containing protein n=1 Tax=Trichophyton rubrum (strain ATCC MYA-4607 / CBS 118892) TaxID=559305 RepID=A0A080WKG0_TRIRC|nr:uncharacterized protein TERG_12030 [Trichophyton rubrum CBS 118892]KFL61272.1 hypothetical protein TERG_12030 [Trichophyton rubrum CBS 118892]